MRRDGRSVVTALSATVLAAAIGLGATLYWVSTPALRMSLGMLLVALVVWASARLALVERAIDIITPHDHPRRFHALRRDVTRLLTDVRRLNKLVHERADRDPEAEDQAIAALQEELYRHVGRIVESAGRVGSEVSEGEG